MYDQEHEDYAKDQDYDKGYQDDDESQEYEEQEPRLRQCKSWHGLVICEHNRVKSECNLVKLDYQLKMVSTLLPPSHELRDGSHAR